MQEAAVSPLAAWQNFYVIIGTAAAALTGDSQRAMAGPLVCEPTARSLRSRGGDLRRHRVTACEPSD